VPKATVAVGGAIAIETSVADVTVSWVELLTFPQVALMFAVPIPTLCASPALLMIAVDGVSDDHVAVLVKFCVVPSENVPVAVNCCWVPRAIEGVCGVIEIEASVAAVTVSIVEPVTVPAFAEIVAVPGPMLLTKPCVGAALLMVATAGVVELHCTVLVMFCVLPSEKVPVAVNCSVVPDAMVGIAGVSAIETRAEGVTVSVVEPLMLLDAAVTGVLPKATLAATPWLLTVAMLELPVLQVTELVKTSVLPSL
jgi:hypothetical protein